MALEENSARSEQDARRSTRWFSRADKRRQGVPNPLEDQDAFDAFVLAVFFAAVFFAATFFVDLTAMVFTPEPRRCVAHCATG